jgi:glyoxylase-like metal-dependent hydrolase (beta-lactamase superfamily II)
MKIITIIEELFESNCFILVSNGHCIVIDPNDANKIISEIETESLIIDYIFLTHEHYDHLSGLNQLRAKYKNIKVLSSIACSVELTHLPTNIARTFKIYLHFMGKSYEKVPNGYSCEPADIVFKDDYYLKWLGHEFMFFSSPGHSMGSILIQADTDYLITGDSLLYGREIISKFLNGNQEQYKQQVVPLINSFHQDLLVLPGHGPQFILKEKIKKG